MASAVFSSTTPLFSSLCAAGAAAAAAGFDLACGRIPNLLTAAALAVSALLGITQHGAAGLAAFAAGLAPPFLLLFPVFALRMIGAGDVKLLMALGSFFGAAGSMKLLFLVFACGGVMSMLRMARKRLFRERTVYFISRLRLMAAGETQEPYIKQGERPENICFSIPILMGTLIYIGGIL